MRSITTGVFMLGCTFALGCAADNDKEVLSLLSGTWDAVAEDEGSGEKELRHGNFMMGIEGTSMGFGSLPGGGAIIGEITRVNASTRPPQIDIRMREDGKMALGIFELRGDKLKFLFQPGAKERPKEFKGSPGVPVFVFVRRP